MLMILLEKIRYNLFFNFLMSFMNHHVFQMLVNEGVSLGNSSKPEEQYFKDSKARISVLDAPFSVIGVINEVCLNFFKVLPPFC